MDISSVESAQQRVREIESRLNQLFGGFETAKSVLDNSEGNASGSSDIKFGDILDNKLSVPEKMLNAGSTLSNVFQLPDAPDISGASKKEILGLIDKYADKYSLDKNLVKAVVQQESGFNPKAVSSAGALGLMQLMPSTAKGLGVRNPFDAEQNIAGGTKYLKNLIDKYDSVKLGLAAYNAGSGAVNKYGGIPPYRETQNYVEKITNIAKIRE